MGLATIEQMVFATLVRQDDEPSLDMNFDRVQSLPGARMRSRGSLSPMLP